MKGEYCRNGKGGVTYIYHGNTKHKSLNNINLILSCNILTVDTNVDRNLACYNNKRLVQKHRNFFLVHEVKQPSLTNLFYSDQLISIGKSNTYVKQMWVNGTCFRFTCDIPSKMFCLITR